MVVYYNYKRKDMDDLDTFENTDAGASKTTPIQAGAIKKNSIVLLKGHPCKVEFRLNLGRRNINLKNWKARPRQGQHRRTGYFHWQEERRYVPLHPQHGRGRSQA